MGDYGSKKLGKFVTIFIQYLDALYLNPYYQD